MLPTIRGQNHDPDGLARKQSPMVAANSGKFAAEISNNLAPLFQGGGRHFARLTAYYFPLTLELQESLSSLTWPIIAVKQELWKPE